MWERDLPLMRAMGANAVRIYGLLDVACERAEPLMDPVLDVACERAEPLMDPVSLM